MHLRNLLQSLLLLTPALAAPHPAPLNCDSLLSFSGPSEHAIVNIRAFCNRRRKLNTSIFKRTIASVFDLPAVRSEQQHSRSQQNEQQQLTTSSTIPLQPADNDQPSQSHTPHQHHNQPSTSPSDNLKIKSTKVSLARLRDYTMRDFQHNVKGALYSLSHMSDNFAIAGAFAVFFVLIFLVAFERWTAARLHWARQRAADTIVVVEAKEPVALQVIQEKWPLAEKLALLFEKGDR